jgi:adenosine deaminase
LALPLSPAFPRVDLHRHLEGSIRLETVIDLCRQHQLELPAWNKPDLLRYTTIDRPVQDIAQAIPKIAPIANSLVDYAACRRVTWEFIEDAAEEGLDYIELRFSPLYMAESHQLDPAGVASIICETWQEAKGRLPVKVGLIAILSRTYGPECCWQELEVALAHQEKGIIGLDLAGDEAGFPPGLFVDHFRKAREAGLCCTVHAGELAGANSVRDAVTLLRPQRIGHGIRAAEDPRVLDLLAENQVAVECCPTSNWLMGCIPSLRQHPIPLFLEKGICATINTDDPTWFGGLTLAHEYQVAHEQIGLSLEQLLKIQQNGVKAAFAFEREGR